MSGLGVYCSTERYISVCICDTGVQNQLYESFYEIEMYASSESWINNISIDVWFGQYLKSGIRGCKNI